MARRTILCLALLALATPAGAVPAPPDESPAGPSEWGFRPAAGSRVARTPPPFAWRPQEGAVRYALQASRDLGFGRVDYEATDLEMTVHCPAEVFEPGIWAWRFGYVDREGRPSAWSRPRRFLVGRDAVAFPLPAREGLLARVPATHPRLFLRPEDLPGLRERVRGPLAEAYGRLLERCEGLLSTPPSTEEPPPYPAGVRPRSERWREIWWGNRTRTIRLLDGAAHLAFAWRLSGNEAYGQTARRWLLAAADWDPRGSTGYRTNDEAGMPFAYHFSRTYTFAHDLLTEAERERCRAVMRVRGGEMYRHLFPRHLWRPYSSHANRAWHFLGEVAIAFLDEIPEARDWLWFAVNVFANVYPVWSDEDGGWHEGLNYWRSYVGRFTWWADVMRAALGLDAYRLPYFARAGDLPLYVMPPGTRGGGFGDLSGWMRSEQNRDLVAILAAQAGQPHWQWYVEAHGGARPEGGYVGLLRAARPAVAARAPTDRPPSRCFRGTGVAALNTTLLDARENVSVLFKSSPFGSRSHGYEAQNTFLLYAFGERLLIRSGRRDIYGSAHHRRWMWHTKSTNNVTIDGRGQIAHSPLAAGRIADFHASPALDYVRGEGHRAWGPGVERFTREILFVKPDLVLVHDRLRTREVASFAWHLHAPEPFAIAGPEDIRVTSRDASCRIAFLWPPGLRVTQTDRFDPPPRPRVRLVEHHLTASWDARSRTAVGLTVLRPHRRAEPAPALPALVETAGGFLLRADLPRGSVLVLLRGEGDGALSGGGLRTLADVGALVLGPEGREILRFASGGGVLEGAPAPR